MGLRLFIRKHGMKNLEDCSIENDKSSFFLYYYNVTITIGGALYAL